MPSLSPPSHRIPPPSYFLRPRPDMEWVRQPPPRWPYWLALMLLALLLAALALGAWWLARSARRRHREPPAPEKTLPPRPRPKPPLHFVPPTDQTRLLETGSAEVYMPTASGRIESAQYGSVRTAQVGRSLLPSFHEGIDIAPLRRDRRGRPLDDIRAVAPGRAAYLNRIAGNSNYGAYVVLLHDEPLGPVYTLYAHLAEVDKGLAAGQAVESGARLGRMGNTPDSIIPMVRAHLHFEIGLVANPHFDRWYRARKMTPDHGVFHGHNLLALEPLAPYRAQARGESFAMLAHLRGVPAAFELLAKTPRPIAFFGQYPALWDGNPPAAGGAARLSVSEGGVPLRGRAATPEEDARLGRARALVLGVSEEALGRNGRRLVVRDSGGWRLGSNGETWLDILLYHPPGDGSD